MTISSSFYFEDVLRKKGLHVTQQRIAILETISHIPHATAENIVEKTRENIGSISRQAVFDALNAFTDQGIIRRIQPASSPARYENRIGDNHHHIVCRHCGAMADVNCAVGLRPCLQAENDHGFIIDEAEVIYWGMCPSCQQHDAYPETINTTHKGA